ncbi:hypothetical protein F66182_10680 [Fusarium sp. NRRL 66182]|nr:hypothetical protein F66182_10680 [Fusarium sp. NRRL 66182]
MDDPWDVPSSPEGRPARPKIKIKLKRSGAQSDSTPDSRAAQDSQNDRQASAAGSRSETTEDSPSGKRKRRKVDHAQPPFQGSNEVDLVTIPFSHADDGERRESQPDPTPSMLPPTLPVNDDVSFYIATNNLTEAQKQQYESVQLLSSDSQNQQLPPVRQFEIQNICSSGEATNINTPRSNAMYLMSTAPPPPSAIETPRAATSQSAGQRWNSSPDVIAAIESPPREKAKRKREKSSRDNPPESADDEVVEVQQTEEAELPAMQETESDSYKPEPDVVEKPTKAKKSRGRPKKVVQEAVPSADPPPPQPEDAEPVTKPKKRRGRPRKSDQTVTEGSPQVDQSGSTNDVISLSEEPARPVAKTKTEIEDAETKDELAEEPKDNCASSKGNSREDVVLKESDPNTLTKSIASIDDDTLPKDSDIAEKEEKPGKPTLNSRGTTPSKGLSSIINKPVYRVGLSKRSRIAPLLKCLRKE